MKKVYFVRHGETYWNVENKICGATDIGLTPHGHEQAVEAGNAIKQQGIQADLILYSPLIRAHDTAQHISEITGIPMMEEPRLKEQNFGKYEGTDRHSQQFQSDKRQFCYHYEGGESMMQVAQRVYNLLDDLSHDERTFILVAHNGISRVVHSYFNDLTNEEYASHGIANAEVWTYEFNTED